MIMTPLAWFGLGAGIVSAVGYIPYISSILKGKTRPERATWWIWSALMVVALAAQIAAGAPWSLPLTVTFLFGNLLVAILSLKHGYGRFHTKDYLGLIITGIGIWLWYITNNPLVALVIIVGVDFLGTWLTISKTWRAPYSESLLSWILMSIASIMTVISVGHIDLAKLIFPVYVSIGNSATVFVIMARRDWRRSRIMAGQRKGVSSRKATHP
jgi:hypothetical protein